MFSMILTNDRKEGEEEGMLLLTKQAMFYNNPTFIYIHTRQHPTKRRQNYSHTVSHTCKELERPGDSLHNIRKAHKACFSVYKRGMWATTSTRLTPVSATPTSTVLDVVINSSSVLPPSPASSYPPPHPPLPVRAVVLFRNY